MLIYIITKSMRALWLVNQLWVIVLTTKPPRDHTRQRYSSFFPFGTERRKFRYHLLNFPVSSLSSVENNYGKSTCKWYLKRHFVRLVCWFWKNPYHYSTLAPTGLFWQMVSTPHGILRFSTKFNNRRNPCAEVKPFRLIPPPFLTWKVFLKW